jgi:hypothetical protein
VRRARRLGRVLAALGACAAFAGAPVEAGAAPQRFALAMLHFNVQYVAGGLSGFYPESPSLELSAEAVEDSIVVESFEPVLDLLLAHPTWATNLELQGYMLDVMAARHPAVLDKLRALAKAGQVDVVSFHYSDQLFLAYPREDWERSVILNRETFERHDVPLSGTVFCQEGQAGLALAPAMADHGYDLLVWPKNLFSYQRGEEPLPAPLYDLGGGVRMVTSRGGPFDDGGEGGDVAWWFVDDGELLATGDFDPYFPEKFKVSPEALAEREAELEGLEAAGYQITTVAKAVEALAGAVPAAAPPPLLDGTWQPGSTDGIHRWLGGFGLWWKDERDNDVRTLGALAHRELLAAEAIAAEAGLAGAEDEIAAGFRLLALGQVTDASGINPFRGEVEYGIAHETEAMRIARDLIVRSKEALGAAAVTIDTGTRAVAREAEPVAAGAPIDAVVPVTVAAGDRAVDVSWREVDAGHAVLTIAIGAGDERLVSVTFPGTSSDIVYTPGLAAEPTRVARDGLVFDHFELALSDGLIGLADDLFVVKDQARVHVSASVYPDRGDVLFHDDTMPAGEPGTWVFHVVEGSRERAAEVARSVNVTPKVVR